MISTLKLLMIWITFHLSHGALCSDTTSMWEDCHSACCTSRLARCTGVGAPGCPTTRTDLGWEVCTSAEGTKGKRRKCGVRKADTRRHIKESRSLSLTTSTKSRKCEVLPGDDTKACRAPCGKDCNDYGGRREFGLERYPPTEIHPCYDDGEEKRHALCAPKGICNKEYALTIECDESGFVTATRPWQYCYWPFNNKEDGTDPAGTCEGVKWKDPAGKSEDVAYEELETCHQQSITLDNGGLVCGKKKKEDAGAHLGPYSDEMRFAAQQQIDDLLADYEYDVVVEAARETRAIERLKAKKKAIQRAKKRLK